MFPAKEAVFSSFAALECGVNAPSCLTGVGGTGSTWSYRPRTLGADHGRTLSRMLEFKGDEFPDDLRESLEDFRVRLENHPRGGRVVGRIVVAENKPEGMVRTLRMYMKKDEFQHWLSNAENRMIGTTAGKTFVGDDEILTAVIAPIGGQDLLDLAAHEVIEIADSIEKTEAGFITPSDPDEADGLTLFNEYCVERTRREIADTLEWPEGAVEATQGLHSVAQEIATAMPARRLDPPGMDFYGAWLEMARSWAMACGRADAGSDSAKGDVARWAEHSLIADNGWNPVHGSLDELFRQPTLTLDQVAHFAAQVVRRPILAYGRSAWRKGP